jgi:F0F1-type ATP synthase epsilon subunit
LLATLDIGVVRIRPADGADEVVAAVDGGFLSVSPSPNGEGTAVSVLAEIAVLAGDIDAAAAQRELAEAQGLDPETVPDAKARMRSAEVRLEAVGQL